MDRGIDPHVKDQPDLPPPPATRFSFELYPFYRVQVILTFLVFGGAAIALVATLGSAEGPSVWFALTWIAIALWNAYWFLFRFAYRLEVRDGLFRWRAPLRTREFPVSDVIQLRPGRGGAFSIEVIETTSSGRIPVFFADGLDQFARALAAMHPQIQYRLNWWGKLALRLPWSSGRFGATE
jgi:hypothetical protein